MNELMSGLHSRSCLKGVAGCIVGAGVCFAGLDHQARGLPSGGYLSVPRHAQFHRWVAKLSGPALTEVSVVMASSEAQTASCIVQEHGMLAIGSPRDVER